VLLLLMPETFHKPLKYLAIASAIRDRIADGTYRPGQQLPASAALAKEHGVALMTVRQALGILQLEGAIEARHGAGTFVADGSARSSQRTRRVLLTEDDRVLCDVIARALRESSFIVDVALNGGEALTRLEAIDTYDAIVLDLKLPDTDGFEIVDYIKANRPAVRVIVASGYVDGEEVLHAAERWPLMLLRKPYTAEELVERLNALVRPELFLNRK
jgi:CheY-like chemotaxis protein